MSPFSLFELNRLVRDALVLTLPEAVWVMAELSEIRQASNGHYYVEFVEKDEYFDRYKYCFQWKRRIITALKQN